MQHKFTNRLSRETSPYLLQHAHNPVDWYPWGEEAFAKARKENKPIFLSVGYSACHWCHVMEHESFEDEQVAELVNKYYVSIKVDREERPDIDGIYMSVVQNMTGQGGWPMTVFMTPEGKPFFAGTYFPKENKYGRLGFMSLAQQIHDAWVKDEAKIRAMGDEIVGELSQQLNTSLKATELNKNLLFNMLTKIDEQSDKSNGGFGSAPKFPSSMSLQLYIDGIVNTQDEALKRQLETHLRLSLRKMAQGGMYDQIGGGFHRYSTDGQWLVPHFEKMLYDNALLATCYFEASQYLDHDFNLRIGNEICDYVLREMTHPLGAFFSTTDADSEGLEGKFFLWDANEMKEVLGEKDGGIFAEMFSVDAQPMGNVVFEGGTPPHDWFHGRIPHLKVELETTMVQHHVNLEQIRIWKSKLWDKREGRAPPGKDTKVLASWNGLMSVAFCTAYQVSGRVDYLEAATNNLEFIWNNMQKEERLFATWKDGDARHFGTLEDYANVANAYLSHFKVCGNRQSYDRAMVLANTVMKWFSDSGKAFFYTAKDAEKLIVRSKNPYDNAVPAGNSVMVGVLHSLYLLSGNELYLNACEGIVKEYSTFLTRAPQGFPRLGREASHFIQGVNEIVLLGADEELRLKVLRKTSQGDVMLTESGEGLPLLQYKKVIADHPTLYVCRYGVCEQPIVGILNINKIYIKN